jgi:hypothetical protein
VGSIDASGDASRQDCCRQNARGDELGGRKVIKSLQPNNHWARAQLASFETWAEDSRSRNARFEADLGGARRQVGSPASEADIYYGRKIIARLAEAKGVR